MLDVLLGDAKVVQMLLPPPMRTYHGTWLLGLEHMLTKLPPKDSTAAMKKVSSLEDSLRARL